MRTKPGQMVINMTTTITTEGAHNGLIIHSGIQSGRNSSSSSGVWSYPSRSALESPSPLRIQRATSPLPLSIGPSTSHEHLNAPSRSSPMPPARDDVRRYSPIERPFRELSPASSLADRESPVYSFRHRDSPPDEFIEPSKITLNVFNPDTSRKPIPYSVKLRPTTMDNADALINDVVSTTTTVEVFRTPIDPNNPNEMVALPPVPAPGLDARPQVLRVNGPAHERWNTSRTETLINDRPVMQQAGKAVQWKESSPGIGLTNEIARPSVVARTGSSERLYRSPYDGAITIPIRPRSAVEQYHEPRIRRSDERTHGTAFNNRFPYEVDTSAEIERNFDRRPERYRSADFAKNAGNQSNLSNLSHEVPLYEKPTRVLLQETRANESSPDFEEVRRHRRVHKTYRDDSRFSEEDDIEETYHSRYNEKNARSPGHRESNRDHRRHRQDRDESFESSGNRSGSSYRHHFDTTRHYSADYHERSDGTKSRHRGERSKVADDRHRHRHRDDPDESYDSEQRHGRHRDSDRGHRRDADRHRKYRDDEDSFESSGEHRRKQHESERDDDRHSHRSSRARRRQTEEARQEEADRRRAQSSRGRSRREVDIAQAIPRPRSVSPENPRRRMVSPDPNCLPGERQPSRATSQEIFHLYQTRDALDNIVAQL